MSSQVLRGVWAGGWNPSQGHSHWGDNGPFAAFTIGSMRARAAMVIFMNSASGLSIVLELVGHIVPGEHPSLLWLNYVRHNAPVRQLLRAARIDGIKAA
jgi:hypothetical protein